MGRIGRLQQLFASALAHQQAGHYSDAERCYRRILAAEPDNVGALNNLARTQQAMGGSLEATANYERAIAIAPRDPRLRVNLGNALAELRMEAKAITAYRHALRLQPGLAEVHNNLGGLLHRAGDLHGAAECYQQAIALNPDLADAHGNLARVRLSQGPAYASAALQSAERNLALQPGRDARRLLARCLQDLRPRRAEAGLRALVQRALTEAWDRPQKLSAVASHIICLDLDRPYA